MGKDEKLRPYWAPEPADKLNPPQPPAPPESPTEAASAKPLVPGRTPEQQRRIDEFSAKIGPAMVESLNTLKDPILDGPISPPMSDDEVTSEPDGSDIWVLGEDGFFARKLGDSWLPAGSGIPALDPFGERVLVKDSAVARALSKEARASVIARASVPFIGRNAEGDTVVLSEPFRFKAAGAKSFGPLPPGKIFGSLEGWEPVSLSERSKLLEEAGCADAAKPPPKPPTPSAARIPFIVAVAAIPLVLYVCRALARALIGSYFLR